MSVYSDFELKIIALAKKDVEESPNYRVLADLESFILKQLAFKKFSDYKFRNWNKHHGEEFLQKFRDWEQEIMAERDNLSQAEFEQRSPVISENDIIDIEALSDKDKVFFYKAKADLLVHEFSESNIFFLEIFLLLIEQMLKMNKRPTDLFDDKIIDKLKRHHKARIRGGETLRQRRSQARDAELKILEIMHDIEKLKRGSLSRWDKHLLLIKFCVVSNIIDIEISKEEERQKKTTAENAKLILDHLKELKGCLAEKKTWKTILSEHKEKEVFNNLGVYSHDLDRHGKKKLHNALKALEKKLCSSASIETVCRDLEKSDKMLLEYGANYHTVAQISYWLDENLTLRPFVQDMLRRVRQRLQTSRITSTEK